MQQIYEAFIENLSASIDGTDLERSMISLLDAFEVNKFAYLSLSDMRRNRPHYISNYPTSWTSKYLSQRYDMIDPVVNFACHSGEPFRWGKRFRCGENSTVQHRMFDEAAEYGICSGLTIPINDRRGGIASLTVAANEHCPALLRMADRYHHVFQLIATSFHIHARRMHNVTRIVDGVQLTRREFECLQWATKGKSAWEIGQILGIKRRTVAFHLDNTRQKLGVRTIAQAVVRMASTSRIPE